MTDLRLSLSFGTQVGRVGGYTPPELEIAFGLTLLLPKKVELFSLLWLISRFISSKPASMP